MIKPKAPCTAECPDRHAGCHNDTCPHGYGTYEADIRLWNEVKAQRIEASQMTCKAEQNISKKLKAEQRKFSK